MKKLTQHERNTAAQLATEAVNAQAMAEHITCNRAISELWGIVGYWKSTKQPSVAEFRGETVPPKMFRMPHGRSVPWSKRWQAVEAWAGGN